MKNNYKFFQHKRCEFYPCHKAKVWKFNCLWCYCPLFSTEECVNSNNCVECVYPHVKDNYDYIIDKLRRIVNMKKENPDICKTTRSERMKKFNRFKDVAHKNFGPTTVCGIGEGKPLICDVCHKRVYEIVMKPWGKDVIKICKYCKEPEVKT